MCGPIAFMLPVQKQNTTKKFLQVVIYHLGRLVAYALIGLFFGILGKSFRLFGWQQQLSIALGVIIILLVILPYQRMFKGLFSRPFLKVISTIRHALGDALKKKSFSTFLTIGFLNGLLPCGLVYMAVFAAIGMESLTFSMLYMVLFGLGTIPLMTSAVYLGNVLSVTARQKIRKVIPVFLVLMGLLFIVRGLGLGIPYLSPKLNPQTELVNANFDCH
jgi:hypothetical protein